MITITPNQLIHTIAAWNMYLHDELSDKEMIEILGGDTDDEADVLVVKKLRIVILQCQDNIEARLQSTEN